MAKFGTFVTSAGALVAALSLGSPAQAQLFGDTLVGTALAGLIVPGAIAATPSATNVQGAQVNITTQWNEARDGVGAYQSPEGYEIISAREVIASPKIVQKQVRLPTRPGLDAWKTTSVKEPRLASGCLRDPC